MIECGMGNEAQDLSGRRQATACKCCEIAPISFVLCVCDERGNISALKARIDIDDCNVCSATIEHAEQSRNASEASAITDTGWDRNYGTSDVAPHDAWQGAFHPGDHDNGIRRLKLSEA